MGFLPRDGVIASNRPLAPIEWEEGPCPICACPDWSHKIEAPELAAETARWFLVVECRHCRLCFTNPRPTPRCLARLYPAVVPPPLDLLRPSRPDPRLAWLWPTLERGRLLDFGCGIGAFLRGLHERGLRFTAVNLAAPAVEFLRHAWGMPAHAGTLPHPELAGATFDVVTLFDVLEHVHQPLAVLRAVHELLAPGGVVVLAVPNIDSLPFRWFGARWPGLDLPRHLTHFTPRTLRMILDRADFRVQRLTPLRHSGWLRAAANRSTTHRLLRCQPLASLVGRYTALCRRANGMLAVAVRE